MKLWDIPLHYLRTKRKSWTIWSTGPDKLKELRLNKIINFSSDTDFKTADIQTGFETSDI